MKKTSIIIYQIIVFIFLFIIITDIYQALFYESNYPFGKGDLGILYKSRNYYLFFSFISIIWLLLVFILKKIKKNLFIILHALITFGYLLIEIVINN